MRPLRTLDLFCGAGGAAMGLKQAGFDEIVGVDIVDRPAYPFEFHKADARGFDLSGFDFIWASPPCQAFTAYKRRHNHVKPTISLVPTTRKRLIASGSLYVIENVVGAPLVEPTLLCGSMFGLPIRRHRLFESNVDLGKPPPCNHPKVAKYPQATNRTNKRCTVEIGVWRIPLEVQQAAMGIDWMDLPELSLAIPPAYSAWIGRAAIAAIRVQDARRDAIAMRLKEQGRL